MVVSTTGLSLPAGWQLIELEPGIAFAVPPSAMRGAGTALDSNAGYFDVEGGCRITFDLGEFGESLDDYQGEIGFAKTKRRLATRSAIEVGFQPGDEDFGWARIMQVDLGGRRTLTIRVSCPTRTSCNLADDVFDSVNLRQH